MTMEAEVSFKPTKCQISKDVISRNSFSGAFAKLRKQTISFLISVRLSACNSSPTVRIVMKFYIWVLFFGKLLRTFKFYCKLTRIPGTLHEDQHTFLIIFRLGLLTMTNVVYKSEIHIIWITFFLKEMCRLWDNVNKYWRAGQATIDDMAHALYMRDT